MLLLLSNLTFSQVTNTKPTNNCYSDPQVAEIFKGLKQGVYLKTRLEKTEKTLEQADQLIAQQKGIIKQNEEIVATQKKLLESNEYKCSQDLLIKDIEITRLNNTIDINKSIAKKDSRKKFWNGIKTGTVGGVVLTVATILIIKN